MHTVSFVIGSVFLILCFIKHLTAEINSVLSYVYWMLFIIISFLMIFGLIKFLRRKIYTVPSIVITVGILDLMLNLYANIVPNFFGYENFTSYQKITAFLTSVILIFSGCYAFYTKWQDDRSKKEQRLSSIISDAKLNLKVELLFDMGVREYNQYLLNKRSEYTTVLITHILNYYGDDIAEIFPKRDYEHVKMVIRKKLSGQEIKTYL